MAYDFNSLTKQAPEASNRDNFYTDFEDVDPDVLHQITELTEWMRTKAKGSDVREVIAQLFERTWLEESKEGNANMEVAKARGRFPVLNDRLNNADRERAENARKLAQKANKDEVTNVMTPKGTLAYASLPKSGNQVGWYYYCPDGDGVHGAGNYVWNGSSWYFGGTGDAGYNLLEKDLSYLGTKYYREKNLLYDEFLSADTPTQNGSEVIKGDVCNILKFVNSGSPSSVYKSIKGGISNHIYVSFKAKANKTTQTNNSVPFVCNGLVENTNIFSKSLDVPTDGEYRTYSFDIPVEQSVKTVQFTLSNIGELYFTELIVSNEEINYDYSLKNTVESNKNEISNIHNDIEKLNESYKLVDKYEEIDFTEVQSDKWMDTSGISSYSGAKVGSLTNIKSGDVYSFVSQNGANIKSYVIRDSNGIVTRTAPGDSWGTNHVYDTKITITDSEDGGTLYINTISANYFKLAKVVKTTEISGDKILDGTISKEKLGSANPLYRKTVVFDGDSICHAGGNGWAKRIGEANKMTWKNYGVGGGTITSGTYGSDGNARHWESTNVATMASEYPNADYVILESCLNDGFNGYAIGELSSSYTDEFDHTTFSGAVEYMLQQAITLFPNAKIGVIIPHRVEANLNAWHEFVRKACKKWSIPYIDLYYESGICVNNSTQNAIMFSDGETHLKEAGYDFITPKIEAWMKTL